MKKSLTIVVSAILAMGMLAVTGCKKDPPNLGSDDVGSWKATEYSKAGVIQLTANDTDKKDAATKITENIDWWAVTNTSGVVLADSDGKVNIKEGDSIEIDLTKAVEGKDKLEVVLWIHQPSVVAKNLPKEATEADKAPGAKTFRGSVVLKTGKGLSVKASDYKEAVQEVSVLAVKCNETGKKNPKPNLEVGTWSGNYRITELYPLDQTKGADTQNKDDDTYMLIGGLKVVNFGNIEEGDTEKVIWPAGNSRVAFRQPNRFDIKNATDVKKETDASELQADWCWSVNMSDVEGAAYKALKPWSSVVTIESYKSDKAIPIGKDFDPTKEIGNDSLKDDPNGRAVTSKNIFTADDFIDPADFADPAYLK